MKKFITAFALMALPASAFASTIAIIDSGSDYKHQDMAAQYHLNSKEIAGNKTDDDANGFIDDVHGWNFAENNESVIDYKYLERLKPSMADIRKFFEVQVRVLDKTATAEDITWIKAKRDDEKFIKELSVFGNFSHGTHVAGITGGHSTAVDKNNHPFAVKIIPTEVKLPFSVQFAQSPEFRALMSLDAQGDSKIPTALRELLFDGGLQLLAKFQTKIFSKIGGYVNSRGADVANGSFGMGYTQAKMIVEMLYNMVFKENERNPAKLEEHTKFFMQRILIGARDMLTLAPSTLYVWAAGNDGTDNDAYPVSPANLRGENSITVAATLRNRELASFSNYGSKVDVAAPGVGISSLYPGSEHGLMSGTSQAAPYVAGVAASVKNMNPNLKASDIKEILMGTVDTKVWLIGKVKSSGLVNPGRAIDAAQLSKEMSVYEAITTSRSRVKDLEIDEQPSTPSSDDPGGIGILPLVSPIN